MFTKIFNKLFSSNKNDNINKDNENSNNSADSTYNNLDFEKHNIFKEAYENGRVLMLEDSDGNYFLGLPLSLESDNVLILNVDSHHKNLFSIDKLKIIERSYYLEEEKNRIEVIQNIKNRTSDIIEEIEYWNEKILSVYKENMQFVELTDRYLKMKSINGTKIHEIPIPFLRSIIFEGQKERETISKLSEKPSKYQGYDFYNQAIEIIGEKPANEIINLPKFDIIIKLLDATIKDKSISPNIHAHAYRILGEIAEVKGYFNGAINNFENAITLNPKIGVKKKLEKLKTKNK